MSTASRQEDCFELAIEERLAPGYEFGVFRGENRLLGAQKRGVEAKQQVVLLHGIAVPHEDPPHGPPRPPGGATRTGGSVGTMPTLKKRILTRIYMKKYGLNLKQYAKFILLRLYSEAMLKKTWRFRCFRLFLSQCDRGLPRGKRRAPLPVPCFVTDVSRSRA